MPRKQSPIRMQSRIQVVRERRVILDQDLAELYQVPNKILLQALRRHRDRFPRDFVFRLDKEEFQNLRLQIEAASWGGRRDLPYAFTEEGVAMLSGLLQSPRAVTVNIAIMREFVRLRNLAGLRGYVSRRLKSLERKVASHDLSIERAFDAIERMMTLPETPKRRIGFGREDESNRLKPRKN